ncbi:reverse transcriptase domain-containing protein [Tanacetum coccineum]
MEGQEVHSIVEEERDNQMTPIKRCLKEGVWPKDKNKARYLVPMLRYVGPIQANYVIREIHMGSCGMHVGLRALVRMAIRQGYYWPTMHEDAKKEVEQCDSFQIHAPVPRLPKTLMTSVMAPWPFYEWGMDILGPLPPARGGGKFIIVAIDYFTKWIEAKQLVKITGKKVIHFVMDNIICRFGLPRIIVTDNGAQLVNDSFRSWCGRFEIHQMNTAVAHPQANGLVERTNKSLIEGIKTRLGRDKAGWVDELPNVLEEYNEEEMRLNLDLLQERRETTAIREARYKTKMEQYCNKKVRPAGFRQGEFVFRRNEASRVEDQDSSLRGKTGHNTQRRSVPRKLRSNGQARARESSQDLEELKSKELCRQGIGLEELGREEASQDRP